MLCTKKFGFCVRDHAWISIQFATSNWI